MYFIVEGYTLLPSYSVWKKNLVFFFIKGLQLYLEDDIFL